MRVSGDQAKALGLPVPDTGVVSGSRARELGLPTEDLREPAQSEIDAIPGSKFKGSSSQIRQAFDFVQDNLERSSSLVTSGPAVEARKALRLAQGLNLGPEIVGARVKEFEQAQKQEQAYQQLQQLPRLSAYMSQSPQHAAAIADETEKWGALEYLFGRREMWRGGVATPQDRADILHALDMPMGDPQREMILSRSYTVPAPWLLAIGRSTWSTMYNIENWVQSLYGTRLDPTQSGPDLEKIKKQREMVSQPIPGDSHPIYGKLNAIAGMTPIVAAAMVHPALAFGVMHADTAGRVYSDLRLNGFEHQEAVEVSNLIGITVASLGAAMGPMFKLKGTLLPEMTRGMSSGLSNSLLQSMAKSPTVWRGLFDLGKNFVANMAMNSAQASAEASIKEAFDSSRENRSYNLSKVTDKAAEATGAWAEMMALSVLPAYEAHRQRREGHLAVKAVTEAEKAFAEREKLALEIHDNYEERGRALRSLSEAHKIIAAVESIKDSEFMKTNPEDARKLIQSMVDPRDSQTVFVKPEAILKLPEESQAQLGSPDTSLGQAGGLIPVNIVDFLSHPEAESLVPHTAGAEDLLTTGEAQRFDFGNPRDELTRLMAQKEWIETNQPESPERREMLNQINEQMRNAAARQPLDEEPSEERRQPAPKLKKEPQRTGALPEAPETPRALKAWAEDAVSRRPSAELLTMSQQHEGRAEQHAQDSMIAQAGATEHARAGREAETVEGQAKAEAHQRQANVNAAVGKAARQAIEEVKLIGDGIARLASEDRAKGPTPREGAWAAGPEYGEAFDGIMEMLGVSRKRGYAAPDLSDIYDKLAREQKLTGNSFDGWDLKALNRLMQNQQEVGNLNLKELREVNKALRQISQGADAENSIRYNGLRVAKEMIKNEVKEHLKNIPDRPPGQRIAGDSEKALSSLERARAKGAALKAVFNQPHTLFFKLGKIGEDLWFEGYVPGVAHEERMWGAIEPKLRQMVGDLPSEVRASGKEIVEAPSGAPERWGLRVRSDVWHLALHLGVEGADMKIASGLGVEPVALHEWVQRHLGRTPEEAHLIMDKLIQPHWKIFDGLWSEYEQHFQKRGLAPPEKAKAQKITIHGKEYDGGYGGRLRWLDLNEGKPILHPGSLEALLESDAHGPSTDNRSLVERTGYGGVPLLNWDGVPDSMRKEAHDIALRPFVEDAHKIFSDGEIRKLLADKMSKQAVNEIFNPGGETSFLHVVARGSVADVHSAQAFTRFVMNLQGRAAYAAFALNFRVMAGQVSHAIAAIPVLLVNPIHAASGLHSAFSAERRAWAHAASPDVLGLRYNNYERQAVELNWQMTGVEQGGRWDQKMSDHFNWSCWREMDAFVSHWVWEMAYAKATHKWQIGAEPMSHFEAVREANKALTIHMPSTKIYDQSSFVRDRSVAGFGYLVRNFPNTLLNAGMLNWWEARVSGKATNKIKAAAQYVGMVMAAEVLGKAVIMRAAKGIEDAATWALENAVTALFYPTMLSEPAQAALHAVEGERAGSRRAMDHMMPASFSMIGQGMDDVAQFAGNGDTEAAWRAASHLMGLVLRSPLPMKFYDISNAARNSESGPDAVKKGMGYRE